MGLVLTIVIAITATPFHSISTVATSDKVEIHYIDVFEKISQIFVYQMQVNNKDSLKWRIIHNELNKMI